MFLYQHVIFSCELKLVILSVCLKQKMNTFKINSSAVDRPASVLLLFPAEPVVSALFNYILDYATGVQVVINSLI